MVEYSLLVFVASNDDDNHEDEDGDATTCSNSDQSGLKISVFSRSSMLGKGD